MVEYKNLLKLKEKPFFTAKDFADIAGIKRESAWVLCSRYVKQGIFIRLKSNFYVLDQNWQNASREYFFRVSNFLQVPSYISFMTALSFHEVTTQAQRDFFESASLKRSIRYDVKGTAFNYYKLKKEFYFGFVKDNDIFIASKEKAFVDSVYLYSFGKYKFDAGSLDLGKLDFSKVKNILKAFPKKSRITAERLCGI